MINFQEVITNPHDIYSVIEEDQLAIDNQGISWYPRTHEEYLKAIDSLSQKILSSKNGWFAIETIQTKTWFMIESIGYAFGIKKATLEEVQKHTWGEVFFIVN